jgi:hypothetical protein
MRHGDLGSGKGKSGGARVIYYYLVSAEAVYFLMIYAKSAKEDLTTAEKNELKKLVDRLGGVQ